MKSWTLFRLKHRLTKVDLAKALGITVRAVTYIEKGEHKPYRRTQAKFRALVEQYKQAEKISRRPKW